MLSNFLPNRGASTLETVLTCQIPVKSLCAPLDGNNKSAHVKIEYSLSVTTIGIFILLQRLLLFCIGLPLCTTHLLTCTQHCQPGLTFLKKLFKCFTSNFCIEKILQLLHYPGNIIIKAITFKCARIQYVSVRTKLLNSHIKTAMERQHLKLKIVQ